MRFPESKIYRHRIISGFLELGRMGIWGNRARWAGVSCGDNEYNDYFLKLVLRWIKNSEYTKHHDCVL